MNNSNAREITQLLQAWRKGDEHAVEAITPLVYNSLRGIAARLRFHESNELTLQATDIVHEAYLRLFDKDIDWRDRAHFYAIAARTMRRVLIDHARAKSRDKRGGDLRRTEFNELSLAETAADYLLDFEEVLEKLQAQDDRKAQVLVQHIFAGMTTKESAEVLQVSIATIERDLKFAKAWVHSRLNGS